MTDTRTTMNFTVRMRRSPFWERSHAAGAKGYIVYNNMLLASGFTSPEDEYHHLKSAVQIWDVGCERQIEIRGPDAKRLVQMSTPRDIGRMKDDQCYYIPTVDGAGGMTNDPVLVKVDEDRYWVSISDSDLMLYYKGVAAALKMDVTIHEPDVAPLAIQGPKADELARRVWGDSVLDIRFFRHARVDVNGTRMILARSGYSVQGGYELYFEGLEGGDVLWDQLMEAGRDLDVRVGCPCYPERVEAGMLSYLSDITPDMTPYEAGLGAMCADTDPGCLGWDAVDATRDPARQVCPLEVAGDALPVPTGFWPVTDAGGAVVGRVSSCCRSYSYECNAAISLIDRDHRDAGTELVVETPVGRRNAVVRETFWGR